jgi:non-homologous end joining protein Ku
LSALRTNNQIGLYARKDAHRACKSSQALVKRLKRHHPLALAQHNVIGTTLRYPYEVRHATDYFGDLL